MKNIEIERKYLVKKVPNLCNLESFYIKQAYISTEPVLRIRQKDDKYIFTFKGLGNIERAEIEREITKGEFENLLKKTQGLIIEKRRYLVPIHDNFIAELDIYEGELMGFINVEVEFKNRKDADKFVKPSWFGEDISEDKRYKNSYLSQNGIKIVL